MRLASLSFLVASVLSSAPVLAAGPIVPFKIDNWLGGGYTNNQTGEFDHCALGAKFQSGHTLNVSITRNGQWLLGLSNPAWTLAPGRAVPLEITLDGRGPIRVYAQPRTEKQYVIVMPSDGAVFQAFRSVHLMQIFANGHLLGFNIDEGARILAALLSCVRSQGASIEVPALPPRASVAPAAPRAPAAPSPHPVGPRINSEARAERDKLIAQAATDYGGCIKTQMGNIVPYSTESAEILSQVILTKCEEAENKVTSLGMALTNKSRAEVQIMLGQGLAKQKANIVAAIVSFRAEAVKALIQRAKPQPTAPAAPVDKASHNQI